MIMHKRNRLFRGKRWIALLAVFTLLTATLSLPLQAARNDRGLMGDMGDGIRRFGRDVSDALTPDAGDGLLPDGSIDDGMANNENPATSDNGGILPGITSGGDSVTTPANTTETGRVTTSTANTTRPATTPSTTTTAPTTQQGASDNETDTETESGFRWTGLIIILIIVAAVVLIIVLFIPKKKS